MLRVEDLRVRIGKKYAIDGLDLEVTEGQVLAIVGESGSGKTLTGLAMLDLLPNVAVRESGRIIFRGKDIFSLDEDKKRDLRGNDISMVFQEPFTAMNPVMNIGRQIRETLEAHLRLSKSELRRRVNELLEAVKLSENVVSSYPHQLSGGMRQRVILAMALACRPGVLILDEPTTALDVSIQKEVLGLIKKIQLENSFAAVFITHDFSVVNLIADNVIVMREGKIIERGTKDEVLGSPRQKYTKKLIACVPRIGDKRKRLLVDD